jgi:hypothetical protein
MVAVPPSSDAFDLWHTALAKGIPSLLGKNTPGSASGTPAYTPFEAFFKPKVPGTRTETLPNGAKVSTGRLDDGTHSGTFYEYIEKPNGERQFKTNAIDIQGTAGTVRQITIDGTPIHLNADIGERNAGIIADTLVLHKSGNSLAASLGHVVGLKGFTNAAHFLRASAHGVPGVGLVVGAALGVAGAPSGAKADVLTAAADGALPGLGAAINGNYGQAALDAGAAGMGLAATTVAGAAGVGMLPAMGIGVAATGAVYGLVKAGEALGDQVAKAEGFYTESSKGLFDQDPTKPDPTNAVGYCGAEPPASGRPYRAALKKDTPTPGHDGKTHFTTFEAPKSTSAIAAPADNGLTRVTFSPKSGLSF